MPNPQKFDLPIHSLERDSLQINILPLDHQNPYDYKREHRHTYFEIILIEKGGCEQIIDFKNYPGSEYSCYIIFPQQVHLMTRNHSTGTVVQFTEDRIPSEELRIALKTLSYNDNKSIVFENQQSAFDELRTLLDLLKNRIGENKNSKNNQAVTNLLQSFISIVIEHSEPKGLSQKERDNELFIAFSQLVESHFKDNKGIPFFIEMLNTTDKKLASASKKHTGLSPLQVIHNRILLEAKRLLIFNKTSNKEIAYDLGFDSPASFSSFIKSKTGLTPTELSKMLTETHKE
jgi:AraC family transcriptional activator of pobA